LEQFRIACGALKGPDTSQITADRVDLLQVMYVNVTQPSDRSSMKGLCPDPLVPIPGSLDLQPDFNHAFWIRVFVPPDTPAGTFRGSVELQARTPWGSHRADGLLHAARPNDLHDGGFSPGNVFQYHGLKTDSNGWCWKSAGQTWRRLRFSYDLPMGQSGQNGRKSISHLGQLDRLAHRGKGAFGPGHTRR
jgi:hypothetical protein